MVRFIATLLFTLVIGEFIIAQSFENEDIFVDVLGLEIVDSSSIVGGASSRDAGLGGLGSGGGGGGGGGFSTSSVSASTGGPSSSRVTTTVGKSVNNYSTNQTAKSVIETLRSNGYEVNTVSGGRVTATNDNGKYSLYPSRTSNGSTGMSYTPTGNTSPTAKYSLNGNWNPFN